MGPLLVVKNDGIKVLLHDYQIDDVDAWENSGEVEVGLKVSGDGKTVTFKLQEGVKFHNGDAFDADVVKWNYDQSQTQRIYQKKFLKI